MGSIQRCARLACASIALLLAACGGGGGGGGGSDPSTAPGISLNPTVLSFAAIRDGTLPPTQNVQITISRSDAAFVGVAVPAGAPPTWLDYQNQSRLTGAGSNWTFNAAILSTSLAPATYTTTLSIGIADIHGNLLAYRNVQISYTVQPPTGLAPNPNGLSFSQLLGGAAPTAQNVGISEIGALSYAWNASIIYQSGSGWLNVNGAGSASGTTLPTTLSVSINSQAALGTLSATIRITGNNNTLDVPVSYTVNQAQMTRSATNLTFNALRLGPSPNTQNITLTTTSALSVPYTTAVTYGTGASGWLTAPASGTAPATITAGVNTTTLAPGSYSATLTINTATQSLPVTVTYVVVEPTLSRSPATLTFNAISGGTVPASQDVTLSTQQNLSLGYTTSVSYAGPSGWLSVPGSGTAPGTVTVSVNTVALAPATYTATVSFTTAASQTVSVEVNYVVAGSSVTFTPPSPSFVIDTTSVAAALSQSVGVGSTGVPLNWTAASSQPWLTVSPTSGSSGSSVTLSLVRSELEKLDPGTRSAAVTFSYTPPNQAATTAPLSVSLNLQLPKITSVNPYVAASGTSLEVILRGSGFNNIAVAPVVNFGGTPGTSPNVVSDTELRVTHPSLSAGTNHVTIPNQLGSPAIDRSAADLVVVDAPAYVAATLAYPATAPNVTQRVPLSIVYDAERKALLVAVSYSVDVAPIPDPQILRYAFSGSAWSATPSAAQVPGQKDMALSPDGKHVFATSVATLRQFDPATLAAGTSTSSGFFSTDQFQNRIGFANDGHAMVTTGTGLSGFTELFQYSIPDDAFSRFAGMGSIILTAGTCSASADGSLVLIGWISPNLTGSFIYLYNSSTSTLNFTGLDLAVHDRPVLDRRAIRILLNGSGVFDSNLQELGSIPFAPTVALSPDGSKAYAYSSGTVLHTYDLNATPDAGGQFPEITPATTLPSDPGASLSFPTSFAVMTVSADGGTVFIAGKDGIVVVPAP